MKKSRFSVCIAALLAAVTVFTAGCGGGSGSSAVFPGNNKETETVSAETVNESAETSDFCSISLVIVANKNDIPGFIVEAETV